jgi:hypothetical protein
MQSAEGPHIKAQITLANGSRFGESRTAAFVTVLRTGSRNFSAEVSPIEPMVAGGRAVHCSVTFSDPASARPHFPSGSSFELWENGRRGYGMVLANL